MYSGCHDIQQKHLRHKDDIVCHPHHCEVSQKQNTQILSISTSCTASCTSKGVVCKNPPILVRSPDISRVMRVLSAFAPNVTCHFFIDNACHLMRLSNYLYANILNLGFSITGEKKFPFLEQMNRIRFSQQDLWLQAFLKHQQFYFKKQRLGCKDFSL